MFFGLEYVCYKLSTAIELIQSEEDCECRTNEILARKLFGKEFGKKVKRGIECKICWSVWSVLLEKESSKMFVLEFRKVQVIRERIDFIFFGFLIFKISLFGSQFGLKK